MIRQLLTLVAGLIFGTGLVVSGMIEQSKILAFLDIAGDWNPSLAIVMAAALLTLGVILRLPISQDPACDANAQDCQSAKKEITCELILGSVIFGIGWGLVGICPGPALVNLATGTLGIIVFLIAMFIGFWLYQYCPIVRR